MPGIRKGDEKKRVCQVVMDAVGKEVKEEWGRLIRRIR